MKRRKTRALVVANGAGAIQASSGYGSGISYRSPSPYPISTDSGKHKWRPQVDRDMTALITKYRNRAMLSDSRYIYTSGGMVSGAVHRIANYAVGSAWAPFYLGGDERFKKSAQPMVDSWCRRCEMRGNPFTWQRILWLLSKALDVDADAFVIPTYDETGYPRLQLLEAHRIGNPTGEEVVKGGEYDGLSIHGGVVYDPYMRPVAYNLLPPDTTRMAYSDQKPNYLPAKGVIHVWDPNWISLTRGIPKLCHGIQDWYSIFEIRDAEQIAVLANSKLAIIEKNETGRKELGKSAFAINTPTAGQSTPHTEVMADGLIRYIKSTGDISAHTADRPGQTWQGFMDHIARGAFGGLDVPLEFGSCDLSNVSAGAMRAIVGQVTRTIENRQTVLDTPALSMLMHPLSTWIRNRELPFTPDWWNWGFSYPPRFTVDVGRDAKARLEELKVGTRTLSDIVTEDGGGTEQHMRTRARDYKMAQDIAKEYDVPIGAVYDPSATFIDDSMVDNAEDPAPQPKGGAK